MIREVSKIVFWIVVVIMAVSILTRCTPQPVNHLLDVPVVIPKGTHSILTLPFPVPNIGNNVHVRLKTNSSWESAFKWDNNDDNDWSKLTGIYWFQVHDNSARAVIRRNEDGLWQIGGYVYDCRISPQTNKNQKKIIWEGYKLPQYLDVQCGWDNYEWYVIVNGCEFRIETEWKPDGSVTGLCLPYYGGDNKAKAIWVIGIKFE